jgi:hypothetical protein
MNQGTGVFEKIWILNSFSKHQIKAIVYPVRYDKAEL